VSAKTKTKIEYSGFDHEAASAVLAGLGNLRTAAVLYRAPGTDRYCVVRGGRDVVPDDCALLSSVCQTRKAREDIAPFVRRGRR